MTDAAALGEFLRERHVPCPNCRYDLHGLRAARCPECDLELVLRVNLVEPRLGLWITAVVGLAAGLGFHGLLIGFVLWMLIFSGSGPGLGETIPLVVGVVVEGPALCVLLACRRWLRAWPALARAAIAAASWMLTLATAIAFFVVVQ